MPKEPRPIYLVGAGGIVNDAHLPAYRIAGFTVAGIFDLDANKAQATAGRFNIPDVFTSLEAMVAAAPAHAVYDVAVPGSAVLPVLQGLPAGAAVLVQKPMGDTLETAAQIRQLARDKQLKAAVNFQLRYAPFINAARYMIQQGWLGELCDIEVNINVFTPWHLWDFLFTLPRVEITYHSIHYIDLVRSFLGNPAGVYAKTVKHPAMPQLASVRSNIIMDYGEMIRASILTNHCHRFGLHRQHSYIKFEGTSGAIKIQLGVLMNYPQGLPDVFEYALLDEQGYAEWKTLPVEGGWFPHAFIGSMAQVMRAAEGSIKEADNSAEDAYATMACAEAAYVSSESGGVVPVCR
jgi:predicted dehydrogenase